MEFIDEADLPLLNKKFESVGEHVTIDVTLARGRVARRLNTDFDLRPFTHNAFKTSGAISRIAFAWCTGDSGGIIVEFCTDASFCVAEVGTASKRELTLEEARFLLSPANPLLRTPQVGFGQVCDLLDERARS